MRLYLVDERGTVIDEYGPNYADLDLPIIDGLSGVPGDENTDIYRAMLARRLLDALRVGNMAGQVSQIDVSDSRNAVVLLEGDPTLIRLGNERFVERLQSYFELAPALREQVPAIDYVDLRFDARVYVRPSKERRVNRDQSGTKDERRRRARGDMGNRERYLVGLDIGTSKVAAIVAEMMDDGSLEIIGIGVSEAKGIRRGAVVNLEAAVESIKHAVDEAELMAGVEVDSVHLAISGPHIKGFNSRGVIAVAGKNREITRDDVRRAIDAAKAVALPTGREILHVLPQDFVVDDQDGIGAPVGMTGARLEVNVHIVTGGATATQNIVACVNRAGISVVDTVIEQLAASEAVLMPDEKELGVAIVDIGGGTTDLAIFERGSLWHTGVIGIGGDHFTNDMAVGLRTPIPDAEKLKRKCGCALSSLVDEDETMEVASVGGRKPG